jgi:hypothetical protein
MNEESPMEIRIKHLETRTDKHEDKIDTLTRFQSWLLGAAAGVGLVAGVFWDALKDGVKLP